MIKIKEKKNISLTIIALGVYFILLPFDCFRVGAMGSILKVYIFVPLLFLILERKYRFLHVSSITLLLLVLLLWAFLSIFFSINHTISLSQYTSLFLNVMLCVVIGSMVKCNNAEYVFLTKCMVLGGWITAASIVFFGDITTDGRLIMSLGDNIQDPNYSCGYMLGAYSFHLTAFMKKKSIIHLIGAGIIFGVVILTGSRGALLSYVFCMLIVAVFFIKNTKYPVRYFFIALLISIVFYLLFSFLMNMVNPYLSERFSLTYLIENGSTGRTEIWINLLTKFKNSSLLRQLFGYGYGTTRLLNTAGGSINGLVAHNLFIEDLISIGVVGLLIRLLLYVKCFLKVLKKNEQWLVCAFGGFMIMSISLSLVNYKPIWSTIIMILMLRNNLSQENTYL